MMNFTDHPCARGKGERGRGIEGMVIDGEETRRRNDGYLHLRHADTPEVPEQGKAKL